MEFDEEKLINLVSGYRELYDLQHEHYMNQQRKNNIWAEIEREMGVSGNICKEKWKCLRDGYNRSIKRRKTKSGDGATKNKPWRYEHQMDFLRHFFQERPPKSNLRNRSISSEEDSNTNIRFPSMPLVEEDQPTTPLSDSIASPTSAVFKAITSRKKKQGIQPKSEVANVLEKYLQGRQTHTLANETNPIHSFFKAMADTVVNLSPDLQLKVKNQVFSAVSEAELEWQQRAPVFQIQNPLLPPASDAQHPPASELQGPPTFEKQSLSVSEIQHASETSSELQHCPNISQDLLPPRARYYINSEGRLFTRENVFPNTE